MYDTEVKEILSKLVIFERMYEHVRFVDPISNKVISHKKNCAIELSVKCFDFWAKNKSGLRENYMTTNTILTLAATDR